jgi:hypothetical protein
MKNTVSLTAIRIKISMIGVANVLRGPLYLLLFLGASAVSGAFLIWSLNLDLVGYILFDAPIFFADKVRFFVTTYTDLFTTYESPQAMGMLLFSVLFGLNITMLVYVIVRQGFRNATGKTSASGLFIAMLGAGCLACGTSLLAPILATFGVVSGAIMLELSVWLLWIGSFFILFSIFTLGQSARTLQIKHNH